MVKPSLKTIGLGFIFMYYEALSKDLEKVSNFYSEKSDMIFVDMEKLHKLHKLENETYPVVKLNGRDSIQDFLTKFCLELSSIKLKIKTFDFQKITKNPLIILLSLTGEVFWKDTMVYNFTQTFVLSSIDKDEQVFEITNSIFRITTEISSNLNNKNDKNLIKPTSHSKYYNHSDLNNTAPFVPSSDFQYQNRYNWNNNSNGTYLNANNTRFYQQNITDDYNQMFHGYMPQQYGYYKRT